MSLIVQNGHNPYENVNLLEEAIGDIDANILYLPWTEAAGTSFQGGDFKNHNNFNYQVCNSFKFHSLLEHIEQTVSVDNVYITDEFAVRIKDNRQYFFREGNNNLRELIEEHNVLFIPGGYAQLLKQNLLRMGVEDLVMNKVRSEEELVIGYSAGFMPLMENYVEIDSEKKPRCMVSHFGLKGVSVLPHVEGGELDPFELKRAANLIRIMDAKLYGLHGDVNLKISLDDGLKLESLSNSGTVITLEGDELIKHGKGVITKLL